MNSPSDNHELPRPLVDDLRSLGGVAAPEELWMRVKEQRDIEALAHTPTLEQAPDELWDRVQAARHPEGTGRVLPWRRLQLVSAAAAVLVLGVLGFRYLDGGDSLEGGPVLAGMTTEAQKEAYRARALGMVVSPAELSSSARTVAQSFGAVMPMHAKPEGGR